MLPLALLVVKIHWNLQFVVVEGVGVMVVGSIGSVQALQPFLLFLHKVGVGASAGGGHAGQPAVGSRLIPGWNRRWGRSSRG